MRKIIYIATIFSILIGIWAFSFKTANAEAVNSMNICYNTTQNITLEIDKMPCISEDEDTVEYIFEQFECYSEITQTDATYTASQFRKLGVVKWGGWRWTWYSERVLKGNGLNIEGRHKDDDEYICDKDGYICCASDVLDFGTVIDTPFGKQGKIYDCGCPSDTIDVYVGW